MQSFYTRLPFLLFGFLLTSYIYGNTGPITVKANENTTVSLFFPSPIAKVIEPAAHFIFMHEPAGNLATLKAKRGSSSNLTVITESGDIYSFALNYSETIQNFTYVISSEQAMGRRGATAPQKREAPKATSPSPKPNTSIPEKPAMETFRTEGNGSIDSGLLEKNTVAETEITNSEGFDSELSDDKYVEPGSFYDMDRDGYYEIFCENSYLQRTITKNNMRDNNGVDLRINHLAVDHDEIYFTMQFRNVSKSDYHIGNVQFYIQTLGNDELLMAPLYTYNLGGLVKQSGVNKFVYVFKDFKLGPDQKVYVVIDEKDGHRNVVLPLDIAELKEDLE